MSLWLVTASQHAYDEYDKFVIRADTEDEARQIAEAQGGMSLSGDAVGGRYQWKGFWLDSRYVTVAPLPMAGPTEIVLGSFNAG